ncbi:MAG: hypothetical protein KDB84_10145, partial [Flavobacteriales bacterium]|nr:hypothetical protein [Flavobacteriales bacterium]
IRRKPGALALVLHDQDLPPGPYALVNGSDTVRMLALDLPRKESDLSSFTAQELREELAIRGLNTITVLDERPEDLSLRLNELDRGHELWKWFVLLALLFLIIEVILLSTKR